MQARASPAWPWRAAPLRLPAAGLANALLRAADPNAQGLDEDADIFWPSRRVQYSSPGWSEVFMAYSQSWIVVINFGSSRGYGTGC